jgi:hypothetical protein
VVRRYSSTTQPYYGNAKQHAEYVDLSSTSSTSIYYQWENFANYMRQFSGHTVTGMVGVSFQKSSNDNVGGSLSHAEGEHSVTKNDPLFYYLNYAAASSVKSVSGETTESTKYSYFGRLSYDYLGRYLLQASLAC